MCGKTKNFDISVLRIWLRILLFHFDTVYEISYVCFVFQPLKTTPFVDYLAKKVSMSFFLFRYFYLGSIAQFLLDHGEMAQDPFHHFLESTIRNENRKKCPPVYTSFFGTHLTIWQKSFCLIYYIHPPTPLFWNPSEHLTKAILCDSNTSFEFSDLPWTGDPCSPQFLSS